MGGDITSLVSRFSCVVSQKAGGNHVVFCSQPVPLLSDSWNLSLPPNPHRNSAGDGSCSGAGADASRIRLLASMASNGKNLQILIHIACFLGVCMQIRRERKKIDNDSTCRYD